LTIYNHVALMPHSMFTDILNVNESGGKTVFTVQTTGPDVLTVYHQGKTTRFPVKKEGIHKIIL